MSFNEAPAPAITAADLLALDESQLVRYLEGKSCADGGFDISNAANLECLSKSQKAELANRLMTAAPQAKSAAAPQSINMNVLHARLTSIVDGPDGSSELQLGRWSPQTSGSARSTLPPETDEDSLAASYHELIEGGGRPVCPLEVVSHILTEPAASYEPVLPWLSHPDAARRNEEIRSVFSRQVARWWDFRKSQWGHRGASDADGDGGYSVFLKANRGYYERIGAHEMVRHSTFDETILRLWQQKPALRLLSSDQNFSAYRETVKRRLAPHHFKRPLRLMKDVRKQTEWATWLEYLNFEQWWLEQHVAAAEARERQYHQAWERLLKAVWSLSKGGMKLYGKEDSHNYLNAATTAAALGSLQPQYRRQNTNTVALGKQLAAAQEDLDLAMKAIDDFIRDTEPYRHAETAVYNQKNRVQWVLKEARAMEVKVFPQRRTAKKDSESDEGKSKKRRSGDDGIPSETWSKRTRWGGAGKDAVPNTVSGQPRRSQRKPSDNPERKIINTAGNDVECLISNIERAS